MLSSKTRGGFLCLKWVLLELYSVNNKKETCKMFRNEDQTKVKEQHRNDKTSKARTINYLHVTENCEQQDPTENRRVGDWASCLNNVVMIIIIINDSLNYKNGI